MPLQPSDGQWNASGKQDCGAGITMGGMHPTTDAPQPPCSQRIEAPTQLREGGSRCNRETDDCAI